MQFAHAFCNLQPAERRIIISDGSKTKHHSQQPPSPFEVTVGNTVTIGRTRENSVCLNFSPLVSRQHAIIRCHNGYQYQLIDLGSRNGTYVDDQRVIMPVALNSAVLNIRIADNTLTFTEVEDERCDEQLAATVAGSMAACEIEPRSRGFARLRHSRFFHDVGENGKRSARANPRRVVSRNGESREPQRRHDRQIHRRRDARVLGHGREWARTIAAPAFEIGRAMMNSRQLPAPGQMAHLSKSPSRFTTDA